MKKAFLSLSLIAITVVGMEQPTTPTRARRVLAHTLTALKCPGFKQNNPICAFTQNSLEQFECADEPEKRKQILKDLQNHLKRLRSQNANPEQRFARFISYENIVAKFIALFDQNPILLNEPLPRPTTPITIPNENASVIDEQEEPLISPTFNGRVRFSSHRSSSRSPESTRPQTPRHQLDDRTYTSSPLRSYVDNSQNLMNFLSGEEE